MKLKLLVTGLVGLVTIALLCFTIVLISQAAVPVEKVSTKNVTCDTDNPNFINDCVEGVSFQFNCVLWDCGLCFWGNDSCINYGVGMRTDCPTKYCTLKPKPDPPSDKRNYLYPVVGVLLALLCASMLYIVKLSRDARRYDRLADSRRRFLGAAEQFAEARRAHEEATRMMRDLAEAANVPIPPDYMSLQDDSIETARDHIVSPSPEESAQPPQQPPAATTRSARLSVAAHNRLTSFRRASQDLGTNVRNVYRPLNTRIRTRLNTMRRQFNRLDEEEET